MTSISTEVGAPQVVSVAETAPVIEAVARTLCTAAGGRVDDPAFVEAARDAWDDLPAKLRRAVRGFRRHSGRQGLLVVRGLPVGRDRLGSTPAEAGSVRREATVGAAALLAVTTGLGDPAAFQPEKSGALVHDVVPVPGQEEVQGNVGSATLSFHNENAFHQHRPDYVLLLCLRADHDGRAGTRTACIRTVLSRLSPKARATLFRPEFVTGAPQSFGEETGAAPPQPVLTGAPDDPDVCLNFATTTALTAEGTAALAELGRLFDETALSSPLEPGDLAIVDNHVAVHGRTEFTPRYDGHDRWLLRSFAFKDLRRSRAARPSDAYVLTA